MSFFERGERGASRQSAVAETLSIGAGSYAWPFAIRAIHFEYVGDTTLCVIGYSSRRSYEFNGKGAVLEVDPRDVQALSLIPKLRRV